MRPESTRTVAPRAAPHRRFLPPLRPSPGLRGLYHGEPDACRRDPRRFLPALGHLLLMLAVFKVFHLEGRAFRGLFVLATAALPVHYLLPFRLKKPAFVAVSMIGLAWAMGGAIAAFVLPAAALLIGACFLPIAWSARASIVAAMGVALALLRPAGVAAGVPDGVWAVLGSIFMFRMILFLYELKHAEVPERPIDALSYFFLLPNFCFTLFPVLDYRAFRRGYFAENIHDLQRTGLVLMSRGTVHLLLCRLVAGAMILPSEVHGPLGLAGYISCNYLKYLDVSGRFHLACGMLHLFGFGLPETHHNYLLARSFTDYWRRINLPWKDFMVRVVFNPVAFRLKGRARPVVLATATVAVFLATWLLHAYQSFWLRGSWGFSVPDALFWGILGAFVLVNVQLDARRSGRRAPGVEKSARAIALRATQTFGTFATIALLWSLWSSPSVGAWLGLLKKGLG